MSLIRKHVAVLQAWACLNLVKYKQYNVGYRTQCKLDFNVIGTHWPIPNP